MRTGLWSLALRRLLFAIPLIFCVIIIGFILIHVAPGNPINMLVGEYAADPQYAAEVTKRFGLDRPLYEQLFVYLGRVISGDLGDSYFFREPVLQLILERAPATLILMGAQFLIAIPLGIFLGVKSSEKKGSLIDKLIVSGTSVLYSLPVFWVGMLLLILFSLYLGWFPAGGMSALTTGASVLDSALDLVYHLVLPVLALSLTQLTLIARLTRSGMLETLAQDYILTARSKGLDERTVFYKHALRNALLPIITVIGMEAGFLLAGAVMTETVFSWPGLGRLMFDSIARRDYPMLMGLFIVISISLIVVNLVTDIAYSIADPRIRYGKGS